MGILAVFRGTAGFGRPTFVWRVGGALLMLAGIVMVTYAKSAGV